MREAAVKVSKEEYRQRRRQLAGLLEADSVAVMAGRRHTGAFDIFRQNNEFFYVCGVDAPQSYLLIEGKSGKTTLYLPGRDAKMERSEGAMVNATDPSAAQFETGVDEVRHYDEFATDLVGSQVVYTPLEPGEGKQMCRDTVGHGRAANGLDPWDSSASREEAFVRDLKDKIRTAEIRDLLQDRSSRDGSRR